MNKPEKPITFLVSDESTNSYGFAVLTDGIDISAFERNPVMLYMHVRGKVFGHWSNLRKENGKLYANPVCDEADDDKEVKSVAGKVTRGVLKAASIGIDISEVIWNEGLGRYEAVRSVLEEISIVDIAGNRNAVRLYANGKPLSEAELTDKLATLSAPPSTDTIKPTNPPVHMELSTIAKSLGLPETATEQQVQATAVALAAESGFKEKYEQLTGKLAADQKTEATTLVDQAIADKRIPADLKDTYLKLFAQDHEASKAILAKLAKPVDLTSFTTGGAATLAAQSSEDLIKLYNEKDRNGSLVKLKADNPTEYSRLFEARWGRKPSA